MEYKPEYEKARSEKLSNIATKVMETLQRENITIEEAKTVIFNVLAFLTLVGLMAGFADIKKDLEKLENKEKASYIG